MSNVPSGTSYTKTTILKPKVFHFISLLRPRNTNLSYFWNEGLKNVTPKYPFLDDLGCFGDLPNPRIPRNLVLRFGPNRTNLRSWI